MEEKIITPDDIKCHGELIHCGTYDCPCGCDPDDNLCFLDLEGLKQVTHLKCRACGAITTFWPEGRPEEIN